MHPFEFLRGGSPTLRLRHWLFALLILGATPVLAQQQGIVVRDIRVEGLQRISEGTVFNYLPVNIGDTLTPQRVREAVRAVYATGFFEDVEFRYEGSRLIIAVQERPSIASFTITGNKDIKTEDLEEPLARVGLKTGRTYDQSVLEDVKQSLTEQYFSQGKYAAEIETVVTDLPGNKVDISIQIKEGDRARIRQINIVGNETFEDEDLLDRFALRTPHWLSWIRQDDRYSREALSGDLETLRSYYMDRGFADLSLESTQVAISPDKEDIFITINIIEGDQYTISDVKLAGDLVLPEEALQPFVQVKPGQMYSQRTITQSAELIQLRLGQEGYAFAEVEPVPELDREAKKVGLTFYVEPKNRVYVRRINFNGAASVNDEVFRREMRQFEGAFLSNAQLERSKIRLQRLPYIESVDFETSPVPGTPDQVDVDYEITEGLPGQFGGGIGYSDAQKVILNANFVHTNFMGTGNRVAADIRTGEFSTFYSLSYTDPYTTINGVSRTLSLSYRDITQFTSDASDFDTTTLSAGAEWSYPLTEYQRLLFGFNWQDAELLANDDIRFSTAQARDWVQNNGNPFERGGTTIGTQFDGFEGIIGWTFDSRNRGIFADRGSRHRFVASTTIPGADVEYYSASYTFTKYVPMGRYFTFSLNADLFYGEAFGDTTSLPPYKNRFAGGPNSVRGFKENDLGPKDSFGNPYGGNILTTAQAEIILPLPESWRSRSRFTAFYDIGNVFSDEGVEFYTRDATVADIENGTATLVDYEFDASELKQSVGLAVQWLAPMGLFRFSYGIPLNENDSTPTDYGDDTERFQFSIGGAF